MELCGGESVVVAYSGGGAAPIAGLSSDGLTPGGLLIAGALAVALQGAFYQAGSDAQGNAYCGTLVAGPSSDTGNPVIRGTQPSTYSADTADFRNDLGHGLHVRSNGQTVVAGAAFSVDGALSCGSHFLLTGTAPAVTHSGTNAVGTLVRATDTRGIINLALTSTGSLANDELCTVTVAVAYAAAPIIVVSALDDATATALPLGAFYTDQTTNPTTTFMLKCTSALAAGTYRCAYVIIG